MANIGGALLTMCRGVRFETHGICPVEIVENYHCQHHLEVLDYLEEGMNFRSRFWRRDISIETELDYQAVQEVDEYMWRFMDSFMLPDDQNAQYWWMVSRVSLVIE